ncbi:MAG: hypothetical protein IH985_09180 [Planctomycetes bacterium]|nr:hypothetical protein [Planctomycetota bacterium]
MRTLRHFGAAIPVTIAIVALVTGLAAVGYTGLTRYGSLKQSVLPTPAELDLLIRRTGVTPETLAAAGVAPQSVAAMITDAVNYIVPNFSAIRDAQTDFDQAKKIHDSLARLIPTGRATAQQKDQLNTAVTNLANARAARDAFFAAIYGEIAGNQTPAQALTLATVKANSGWSHPVQYKAANRSEPEWVDLRDALATVRIADKRGEQPDPAAVQLIAQADANAAVSAARTGLNNLPLIQIQWENAINP